VVLVGNGSNLLNSNIPVLPAGSNLLALRQTLGALKFYVNDVLQFNFSLANEVNPQRGVFTVTGSNGLSNILSSVAIDNAFSVSNAAEFLQDVSIAGVVSVQSVVSSNLILTGNLTSGQLSSLSNQVQGVSNQVWGLSNTINTVSNQASWSSNHVVSLSNFTTGFSNDIYPRYTFTSNQSVFGSNAANAAQTTANFGSNAVVAGQTTANFASTLANSAQTTANFGSNLANSAQTMATWSSNNFSNVATSTGLASYSNFVSANFGQSNVVFSSLNGLSNSIFPLSTFGCNASVWSSNGLNSYSNYVSTAFAYSNPLYLYVNAQCNQTWSNTTSLSTLSNSFAAWSNLQNTTTVNMSNYTYTSLTNTVYSNNLYCSNSTVFASNTAVSASNVAIYSSNIGNYCSNNFPTFSNAIYPFVNSNTSRSTFGSNTAVYTSNQLPNYRLSSVAIDYSTLTNKPSFDAINGLAIGAATISGLGALGFAGSEMFLKDGYLTGVLQSATDTAHNAINLASGYQRLSSFLEVDTGTTRIQDNLIIMKSNASSNLILSPFNLTTSNSIFSLNSLINTTATSISNITHVSCSSSWTSIQHNFYREALSP
jgi:hypothetical protein